MRRDALHADVVLRRIIFPNYISCVVSGDELKPTIQPTPQPLPGHRTRFLLVFLLGLMAGVIFLLGALCLSNHYGGNINECI